MPHTEFKQIFIFTSTARDFETDKPAQSAQKALAMFVAKTLLLSLETSQILAITAQLLDSIANDTKATETEPNARISMALRSDTQNSIAYVTKSLYSYLLYKYKDFIEDFVKHLISKIPTAATALEHLSHGFVTDSTSKFSFGTTEINPFEAGKKIFKVGLNLAQNENLNLDSLTAFMPAKDDMTATTLAILSKFYDFTRERTSQSCCFVFNNYFYKLTRENDKFACTKIDIENAPIGMIEHIAIMKAESDPSNYLNSKLEVLLDSLWKNHYNQAIADQIKYRSHFDLIQKFISDNTEQLSKHIEWKTQLEQYVSELQDIVQALPQPAPAPASTDIILLPNRPLSQPGQRNSLPLPPFKKLDISRLSVNAVTTDVPNGAPVVVSHVNNSQSKSKDSAFAATLAASITKRPQQLASSRAKTKEPAPQSAPAPVTQDTKEEALTVSQKKTQIAGVLAKSLRKDIKPKVQATDTKGVMATLPPKNLWG